MADLHDIIAAIIATRTDARRDPNTVITDAHRLADVVLASVRAELLAWADEVGDAEHLGGPLIRLTADRVAPEPTPKEAEPELTCPRCGSDRWVSVSLDEGWTRRAQCVPCGQVHASLGPGWRKGG